MPWDCGDRMLLVIIIQQAWQGRAKLIQIVVNFEVIKQINCLIMNFVK